VNLGSSHSGWATTVWVDPGGTTGWAVMSVNPQALVENRPIHKCIEHWAAGQYKGNENQMASEMLQLYDVWDDAAIGIESFTLRQMAVELSPVSIKAKIEYGLWLQEKWEAEDEGREMGRGRHLWSEPAALAKSTLPDDRMREYGLWTPGPDHPRDATKHCYTFLQRAQQKPRLRCYAWPSLYNLKGELKKQLPPTSKAKSRGRTA
jgi:hypothetical protein